VKTGIKSIMKAVSIISLGVAFNEIRQFDKVVKEGETLKRSLLSILTKSH